MTIAPSSDRLDRDLPPPVACLAPEWQSLPLVLASPHSGSNYPEDFVAASRLDRHDLRRSEDCHVHDLLRPAAALGAPLLWATFPRAYLDVNRAPNELDPGMFDGPPLHNVNARSPRVTSGLGVIARVVSWGMEIYWGKLPVAEIDFRMSRFYHPYHDALTQLVRTTKEKFGYCVLLDFHSMPTLSHEDDGPHSLCDEAEFVLGDCHGSTCHPSLTMAAQSALEEQGYLVSRNVPYAGGHTTRSYGRPARGVHVLQVEIARRLYMNEDTYEKRPRFGEVAKVLTHMVSEIATVPAENLFPR